MKKPLYRIVIADDHHIFRLGLKAVIENHPSYTVSGEAGSGEALLALLSQQPCDLVILDLSMPGMDGYEILDALIEKEWKMRRIVLSMHVDRRSVAKAMTRKIDGFVNKEDVADVILDAIASVRQGKKYFSQDIQELILSHYDELFGLQDERQTLTPREKQVAAKIATGLTHKVIAKELGISVHTVQFHRSNLMAKLGLRHTADLVKYVLDNPG
jgi:two-component system, NarL family, invasion response regulator UvrY